MQILVVLQDQHRDQGANALLLRKAAVLARALGASLELFHVVYDRSLELSLLLQRSRIDSAREARLNDARSWLTELADGLKTSGLSVRYDVRWGQLTADTVIEKVQEGAFDWVLTEARDDHYRLGLIANNDWDLLRNSPVPVYFVKGANPPSAGVLVALEGLMATPGSPRAALDYDVYRQARRISETFNTPMTLVHAFQVPTGFPAFTGYMPLIANATSPDVFQTLSEAERRQRETVARQHGSAIKAFADYFAYPVADIVVRQGAPDLVISDEAQRRQCGLVVMGAGEAGTLDRLLRRVAAEPTLAEAECDILFVKPTWGSSTKEIGEPQVCPVYYATPS